jgi:hypothetical protein
MLLLKVTVTNELIIATLPHSVASIISIWDHRYKGIKTYATFLLVVVQRWIVLESEELFINNAVMPFEGIHLLT